jgi:hypothetical protein
MLHTILIDIGLLEGILIVVAIGQPVTIVARVLEWAVPITLVKVLARYVGEGLAILID